MKYYKLKVDLHGAKAGDLLIFDQDTNTYIISKTDMDFSANKETTSSVYVELPATWVENDSELFELMDVKPFPDMQVETLNLLTEPTTDMYQWKGLEATPIDKVVDAVSRTSTEISERMDAIANTIHGFTQIYGTEFVDASEEVLNVIADLQAEYNTLNWVINK